MGNIDLDEIALAISLDSLARSPISPKSALHMHVSKPPKEGQAAYEFLKVTLSLKVMFTFGLIVSRIDIFDFYLHLNRNLKLRPTKPTAHSTWCTRRSTWPASSWRGSTSDSA